MGLGHIIAAMVGIFVLVVVVSPFLTVISDTLIPALYTNTSDEGKKIINLAESMWLLVPIILIVGLLLYGFMAAHRREYDSTRERPAY